MKNNTEPGLALDSGEFITAEELSKTKKDPNEDIRKQLLDMFEKGIGFPVVEKKKITDILLSIYNLGKINNL
jgi:hypothetical protein